MGVRDLFPPPSSSFSSVVRQERDLQPLPAVSTLCWRPGWGVGGEEWRAEGLGGKLVEEPRTEASILFWEVPVAGGRALDLGAAGLGSSPGSAVKPWPRFLTPLGLSFPISKMGSFQSLPALLESLIYGITLKTGKLWALPY